MFLGLNVFFIAAAGALALLRQVRALARYHPWPLSRRVLTVGGWLALSLLVGGQVAWTLRPFLRRAQHPRRRDALLPRLVARLPWRNQLLRGRVQRRRPRRRSPPTTPRHGRRPGLSSRALKAVETIETLSTVPGGRRRTPPRELGWRGCGRVRVGPAILRRPGESAADLRRRRRCLLGCRSRRARGRGHGEDAAVRGATRASWRRPGRPIPRPGRRRATLARARPPDVAIWFERGSARAAGGASPATSVGTPLRRAAVTARDGAGGVVGERRAAPGLHAGAPSVISRMTRRGASAVPGR